MFFSCDLRILTSAAFVTNIQFTTRIVCFWFIFSFCTVKLYGESVCCIIVCLHFYRPWISTTQQLCVYPNVATRGLFCSCYHCAYHRCDSGSWCLLYFESIWWRLFQKRVVRHKFAIYVFINMTRSIPLLEDY